MKCHACISLWRKICVYKKRALLTGVQPYGDCLFGGRDLQQSGHETGISRAKGSSTSLLISQAVEYCAGAQWLRFFAQMAPPTSSTYPTTVSGFSEMVLNPFIHQPLGEVRMVRGALPADAHVASESVAGLDRGREEFLHRWIAFIKGVGDQP